MDSYKYDVFFCYSTKDQVLVLDLAKRLDSDGVRIWIDEWKIRAGDNIVAL